MAKRTYTDVPEPRYVERAKETDAIPKVTSDDNGKILTVKEGKWTADTPEKELPEVTSEDNGKFLRVVDAQWTASEVPLANGEGF